MNNTVPKKSKYDEEPVYYCKNCHSLNIKVNEFLADEEWDGAYCANCNSCNIGECSIDEWVAEEERRKKKRMEIEWNK